MRALILATGLLSSVASADRQVSMQVHPTEVLEGEPVSVLVTGLKPGATVRLNSVRAWTAYPTGTDLYRGSATFEADALGTVDLRTSVPLPGSTYDRVDPAGLFWSMARAKPMLGETGSPLAPGVVQITVEDSERVLARAHVRLLAAAPGVAVREVRDPGVIGVFAQAATKTKQPAVIVLGGSEGGLFTARWAVPLLASYGYAVLGVGYFRGDEPGLGALPANLENIPLETLERARDWLARQPDVDPSRLAIVGVSKGAEMALVGASTFPWVTAVGAFAPTHVVWEGIPPDDRPDAAAGSSWTYGGKPLPFVRWSRPVEKRADRTREATGSSRLTEVHLELLAEFPDDVPPATIPIEKSRAAVFVAAGTDDGMWPAAYSAERLRRRLGGRDPSLTSVFEIHPTGHNVMGSGWGPTTQFQRTTGRLPGGNARLDAAAQKIIWPRFLEFLERHLQQSR